MTGNEDGNSASGRCVWLWSKANAKIGQAW